MGAKRPLNRVRNTNTKTILLSKAKFPQKQTIFARRFLTLYTWKLSHLSPFLSITFPQGFRISLHFGHVTSGRGGKKTFKRYPKSEQTHKQTHRHTDKSTYRKHRPRYGRCFEKKVFTETSMVIEIKQNHDTFSNRFNMFKIYINL